jgi:hypothetical protein
MPKGSGGALVRCIQSLKVRSGDSKSPNRAHFVCELADLDVASQFQNKLGSYAILVL